nr:hypothetical protein [Tanacetum cinerariifolium]
MEEYMSKTHGNYGSVVARPKINDKTHFELKWQFLKELCENTFSGSEHEDANEHIKKDPEIVDLFHIPKEVILFYNGLDVSTRQILDSKGAIPTKTAANAKPREQYRAAGPGFYQCNNRNSLYPERRQTLEESLTKFIAESAKRHEENSNIIKEIRASTDAAIRNQGASIKNLEIQIGQMSKVLQERGIRSLTGSTEPNLRDHVKTISTAKADSFVIHLIESGPYAASNTQYSSLSSKIVLFPDQLHGYYCDDWKDAREANILETYAHTLPQKENVDELPCLTQYFEANNLPRSEFIVTLIRKFIEIAVIVKILSLSLSTL